MSRTLEQILTLREAMNRAVLGQQHVAENLIVALLCNGNVLLEGLPGTAKTRSIKSLSKALDSTLGRIQFTPDLLPSDVTGTEVFHNEGEGEQLVFQPGPLFNNLVLADEINRAPAKVQSALLEAMEEKHVTVAGKTYPLPQLFMVLATQNPIEQEGTYPLPEAQMDRFLLKVNMGYPADEQELDIMRLVRSEELQDTESVARVPQEAVFRAREQIHEVHVDETLERYVVGLIMATRDPGRYEAELSRWIAVGSSPRATIALDRCARAKAWLAGRSYATPEDVRDMAEPVLTHRIITSYEAQAEGISAQDVVRRIKQLVAAV
ncbi:MAG: MoxR family ATPase [Candidatus Pelagadaptatus aseana]|uniref:AAA family ATPase n=1 Tax=Candidatus Pelagadaptatus aseana TaxID=3120508 RepID=UPI0039B22713